MCKAQCGCRNVLFKSEVRKGLTEKVMFEHKSTDGDSDLLRPLGEEGANTGNRP